MEQAILSIFARFPRAQKGVVTFSSHILSSSGAFVGVLKKPNGWEASHPHVYTIRPGVCYSLNFQWCIEALRQSEVIGVSAHLLLLLNDRNLLRGKKDESAHGECQSSRYASSNSAFLTFYLICYYTPLPLHLLH